MRERDLAAAESLEQVDDAAAEPDHDPVRTRVGEKVFKQRPQFGVGEDRGSHLLQARDDPASGAAGRPSATAWSGRPATIALLVGPRVDVGGGR